MSKKKPAPNLVTPEDQIEQMHFELLVLGFAVAKQTSILRGIPAGTMPCPLCGQELRYSTAPSNGHFRAHCAREGCVRAIE